MTHQIRRHIALLAVMMPRALQGSIECVTHETLKCINDASSFWPRCDPSQTKNDNFPNLHGRSPEDYGYFCTEQWAHALNAMLSHSVVGKCADKDAQVKLLAQIAVETGYFTTLFQPADGGAGLVHMIPNNWPINAQDMEDLFGGNFVQRLGTAGAEFFQSPEDGWLSVAAWYKLTNRVIPGCGKDLFDESFSEQTRCIFSRPNDRSEAFNIVSQCLGATPSTTFVRDGICSGSPCLDASHCRSKFGFCGSSSDHCNSESTWKIDGCGDVSVTTTTSITTSVTTVIASTTVVASTTASMTSRHDDSCSGSPCGDVTYCRSEWGWCGSGANYCNAKSTWTAAGCGVKTSTSTMPAPSTTLVQTSALTSSEIRSTTSVQTLATTTLTASEAEDCQGAPCFDPAMCRSKWGWCGSSSAYCNMESTWKIDGCEAIKFAASSLNVTGANFSLSLANRTSSSIDCILIIALVAAFVYFSIEK